MAGDEDEEAILPTYMYLPTYLRRTVEVLYNTCFGEHDACPCFLPATSRRTTCFKDLRSQFQGGASLPCPVLHPPAPLDRNTLHTALIRYLPAYLSYGREKRGWLYIGGG